MNKYFRACVVIPAGLIKTLFLKILHPHCFSGVQLAQISPFTEITLERGAVLKIGKKFKMRDGAKIRVRKGAELVIGDNVSLSSFSVITCRHSIFIGNDVEFSPNIQLYDHDHDFRDKNGLRSNKFIKSKIKIGNNVWIGANSIILRGSCIGDNSVVAAGSVIKGDIPPNSVVVQKKTNTIYEVNK